MMSRQLILFVCGIFFSFSATVAQAIVATWEMEGNVTSVGGTVPGGIVLNVDDLVTITIQYDTGSSYFSDDGYPLDPNDHYYTFGNPVLTGSALFAVEVNGFTWYGSGDWIEVIVTDDSSGDSLFFLSDGAQMSTPPDLGDCCSFSTPDLILIGTSDLLTSDALPVAPDQVDLDQLISGSGGVNFSTYSFDFSVSTDSLTMSSIPVPTTLALMGLGLTGIGYRRYCSKMGA